MIYVTTSWDDGDVLDLKVAEILSRYNAKGTFYITQTYREHRLSESQIKNLSHTHEIGAHTLTHPNLPLLSTKDALKEIKGSKDWLEEVVDKEVPFFCYPFGYYNESVAGVVQDAGFKGARTTVAGKTDMPNAAFEIPTTLHVYPFPFRKTLTGGYYWRYLLEPLKQRYALLRSLGVRRLAMTSWQRAARAAFDHSYKHGKVFHLWGHSWELESYDMWKDFEDFMRYIASHKDVEFVTNSELLTTAALPIIEIDIPHVQFGGEGASWTIAEPLNSQSVVYSFGAGEDVSWDLALIERYSLTINAFDPTPKSIEWLKAQKLPQQFVLHKIGLGNKNETRHFTEPIKAHWVSYSMVREGEGIEAPVKRLQTIMRELGHTHIDVLKIDIEGGEYEVLDDILASHIPIKQILVEFHHRWNGIGMGKTKQAIQKLNAAGYKIFYISPSGEEYSFIYAKA